MNKPASLRQALADAIPDLKRNPDNLHVFIDEGRIIATGVPSLSFEYRYTLNLIITDFTGHPDSVIVPIIAWLHRHQIDMLQNRDLMRDGFSFEADILSHTAMDLSIKLALTESVSVQAGAGGYQINHPAEPLLNPFEDVENWTLFVNGQAVSPGAP